VPNDNHLQGPLVWKTEHKNLVFNGGMMISLQAEKRMKQKLQK